MASKRVTLGQLQSAINKVISETDKVIPAFQELLGTTETYETIRNTAKTVGTALETVGILMELSKDWFESDMFSEETKRKMKQSGSMINAATDCVDHVATKVIVQKIKGLLVSYNEAVEPLQDLFMQLATEVNEVMKHHGIDNIKALIVTLDTADNPNALLQLINGFKNMDTTQQSALAWFQHSSLIKSPTEIVQFQYILRLLKPVGDQYFEGGAITDVAMTVSDVYSTIQDWQNDHPTVTEVKRVIGELNKTKTQLKVTLAEVKQAAQIIKDNKIRMLQQSKLQWF
jgi:hypothetical protein